MRKHWAIRQMIDMKQGWEIKKLSEVCDFQNGFAFKSKTFKTNGTPLLRITNIQNETIDVSNVVYIDPNDYDRDLSRYEVVRGDLLIAMSGATTGKIGVHESNDVLLLNQRVGKFKPKRGVLKTYMFYYLLTKVEESLSISEGAAQPNLSTEQIKSFQVPIPPLETQKQIVAVLDEAFAAIDLAKANIEKNLQNAKELFQSKLNQIFTQKGGSQSLSMGEVWQKQRVDEVARVVNGFSFKSKDFSPSNTAKSIKITNVGVQEFVEGTDSNLPESFLDTYKSVRVICGDLVLALTRTIISSGLKVAIIPESFDGALLNQRVAAISPKNEIIKAKFLYYFFCSEYVSDYVLSNVNALMQPNLSIKDLKRMEVSVPSIMEQQDILMDIDSLLECTSLLDNQYQSQLLNIDELKKSILQKAFAGELIHGRNNV